jgi:hypothetical protein
VECLPYQRFHDQDSLKEFNDEIVVDVDVESDREPLENIPDVTSFNLK